MRAIPTGETIKFLWAENKTSSNYFKKTKTTYNRRQRAFVELAPPKKNNNFCVLLSTINYSFMIVLVCGLTRSH